MVADLLDKLKKSDLDKNQFTYDYFSHTDHVITDDYYEEISALGNDHRNKFILLKLLYGVKGLGHKVQDYLFHEYLAHIYHPYYSGIKQEFIRILEEEKFLLLHVQELKKKTPTPFLIQILKSSKMIRPTWGTKEKVNTGTFIYKDYFVDFIWKGRRFSPVLDSRITKEETKPYTEKYNKAYRAYLSTLFEMFIEGDYEKDALHNIFFTLPWDFDNYHPSFDQVLSTTLDKAIRLGFINGRFL